MPKCNFNTVEIAFRHGCSPANLLHIFRTNSLQLLWMVASEKWYFD